MYQGLAATCEKEDANTVVMSGKDMTWHIRVSGTPESQHLEIYNALKVKDPLKRNKQNVHLRL